jgi:carboxyl-terminal processing protease
MRKLIISVVVLFFGIIAACSQPLDQSMRKMNMVMYSIENFYVDNVDAETLTENAIIALLKELDPHSEYMNKDEVKEMNEPLQGNFDGIGIQFNMLTDTLYVIQVIHGGPSEKVGILAGDRIIEVNDTSIVKMNNTEVMKRLRGKKGTTVRVKILRKNELIEFKIIRDKIPIYSLDASYMADKTTGYIRLNRFAATTHDEFLKAFKDLKSKGMENLILDLQGNGGGYLNAAINLADEFLGANRTIVYTEGVHQKREDAKATSKGVFENGKLVILINEGSASASEIVSGAVQDWDRGVIIGRRSFGKGLVQRPIPFPDGSMIRLTTAKYYTPTGRCIQKPYENGDKDQYNRDLIERYNRGEMISADSIHFPDSLRYYTLMDKRVVYGGGGIMPDLFVPIDTTFRGTNFHRNAIAKGIINKVSMNYVDHNRDSIKKKYKNISQYATGFTVPEEVMNDLLTQVKEDREESYKSTEQQDNSEKLAEINRKDQEEFQKSKSLISLQIKALIARDVWDMSEYLQILNQNDDTYKKALEVINNTEEYNKLLGKK